VGFIANHGFVDEFLAAGLIIRSVARVYITAPLGPMMWDRRRPDNLKQSQKRSDKRHEIETVERTFRNYYHTRFGKEEGNRKREETLQ